MAEKRKKLSRIVLVTSDLSRNEPVSFPSRFAEAMSRVYYPSIIESQRTVEHERTDTVEEIK